MSEQFELPLERMSQGDIDRIPMEFKVALPKVDCEIINPAEEKVEIRVSGGGVNCIFIFDTFSHTISLKEGTTSDSFIGSELHHEPKVIPLQSAEEIVEGWRVKLSEVIKEIKEPTVIEDDSDGI